MSTRTFSAILVLLAAAAVPYVSATNTVTHTVPFPDFVVRDGAVLMPGAHTFAEEGKPLLPVRTVRLLLPPNTDETALEIDVRLFGVRAVKLADVAPAPRQVPIGSRPSPPTAPDSAIYENDAPYPAPRHRVRGVARAHGYPILVLQVYPVRWNPVTGGALVADGAKITVRCPRSTKPESKDHPRPRGFSSDRILVARLVDNPRRIALMAPPKSFRVSDREYVIVTSAALAPTFQGLADHRASVDGLTTHIATVEDITSTYSGRDDAEKIRAFVLDSYVNHGTRHLVLGGDSDVVPHRGCYGRSEVSTETDNLPTDMYFGALDGDWNADGDGVWGEPEDDVDLLAEVSVGRIAAGSTSEAQRQIDKIIAYETWASAPFHTLLVGEQLDSRTWGGDMLDYLYERMAGVPRDTLYERDQYWSDTELIDDYLNTGSMNLINHVGHANASTAMKLSTSQAAGLTNANPFAIYSHGCYAGAFDTTDCMAEAFTVKGTGGAHAVIMNSRYGWYSPGSVFGTANLFHREFLESAYEGHIVRLGEANDLSRHRLAGLAEDYGSVRWSYFGLTLFGDPATPLHWQCSPSQTRIRPTSLDDGFRVMRSDQWTLQAAVHDDCAGAVPDTGAVAQVDPSNGDPTVSLGDDGTASDEQAEDGVYSGTWVPGSVGPVTLTYWAQGSGLTEGTLDVGGEVVPWMQYTASVVDDPWIDTSTGTVLSSGSVLGNTDDGGWIVQLGFDFQLYGVTYSDAMVDTNGLMQMEHGADYSLTEESFPVPYDGDHNGLIAPWWCDLDPGYSGTIRTLQQGTAPNRSLTVEWLDVEHYGGSDGVTFQVTLYETTNEIVFRYQDTSFDDSDFDHGADATVGIEGPNGVHGLQWAYHDTTLSDGLAVRLSPISSEGELLLDAGAYACSDTVEARVLDLDLEGDPSVVVTAESSTETDPLDVTLVPDGDPRVFAGTFGVEPGPPAADGVLQVSPGDTITVRYQDASPAGERTAEADVDCTPPEISGLLLTPGPDSILVSWDTSEPATATVGFGTVYPGTFVEGPPDPATHHEVLLDGLQSCTRYTVLPIATDPCGNQAADDNGGLSHWAVTLGWTKDLLAGGSLNTDPGWAIDNGGNANGWEFGQPIGGGGSSGDPDPTSGFTGSNVYGVNLNGDYDHGLDDNQLRLTTPTIDCSQLVSVDPVPPRLTYRRWLGVESSTWDHARVQVQVDGSAWQTLWENGSSMSDGSWVAHEIDLPTAVAGSDDVLLRWTLGSTDGSVHYCGWNIDDVVVSGSVSCQSCLTPPAWNGSGGITGFAALAGDLAGLDIAWDSATATCGTSVTYDLYLARSGPIDWGAGPTLSGLAGTSLQLLGITPGVEYTAAVRAVDFVGNTTTNCDTMTAVAAGDLAGDADCDDTVTGADVAQVVDVLFGAVPGPCGLDDADGSGSVDAADPAALLVYLGNGLY